MPIIKIKNDKLHNHVYFFDLHIAEDWPEFNPKMQELHKKNDLKSTADFILSKISKFNPTSQTNALNCMAGNMVLYYRIYFDRFQPGLDVPLACAIPLARDAYSNKSSSRYYKVPFITRDSMADLLDECVKAGLITIMKGGYRNLGYKKGFLTIIQPEVELFERLVHNSLATDFVKHQVKPLIEIRKNKYQLTAPTKLQKPVIKKLEAKLIGINKCNTKHKFEVITENYNTRNSITSYDYSHTLINPPPLGGRFSNKSMNIDISTDIEFRRIFNYGSLKKGGRLYAKFQNIPSDERKSILIDGQKTVELDYSCHHSRILYNHPKYANTAFTGDIYDVGLASKHCSKKNLRDIVKAAFLIIYNCKSWREFYLAYESELESRNPPLTIPKDLSAKGIVAAIKKTHPDLKKYFCKDLSGDLMYMDGQIAEALLADFASKGKPCLAVHDSFIVEADDQILLKSLMISKYQQVLGTRYQPII